MKGNALSLNQLNFFLNYRSPVRYHPVMKTLFQTSANGQVSVRPDEKRRPIKEQELAGYEQVAQEVDARLDAWRSKATGLVLIVACAGTLPLIPGLLQGRYMDLPWFLRIACLALFLAILLAAIRPRWNLRWRVSIIFATLYAFAAIQLSTTLLVGSGRLSILSLPVLALVLAGPRVGWIMTVLSLTLFAAIAIASSSSLVEGWRVMPLEHHSGLYWFLQWARLAGTLAILMVLLTQYHVLQRRSMIAERMALRNLEQETADRRRLEDEITRVSESERRAMGAELHDGLCQHLTAILLNCTALENRRRAASAPEAEEVARIRESVEEAIDMAYDAAHGLCPVDFDAEGLVAALEGLCRTVQRRGMACELQTNGNVAVGSPDCALQLYRIASEAMTNAVKHANCARIVVRLARCQDGLELSVADDGKGLAEEKAEGLGRRIMAYRAALMGGEVTVSGRQGQGTTVLCRIPDAGGAA